MDRMPEMQELLEKPLSADELGMRYRTICEDPSYANIPGKIELDMWGRMVMSPSSSYHSALQVEMAARLRTLPGRAFVELSILTSAGVLVADVAWASAGFMTARGFETPYARAPEICVEVTSPSNSRKEMREKIDAYLAAGAEEVWLVYPISKRCEFFGRAGVTPRSSYAVDLDDLFD
jgi:Uma2 family endonuclease